VVAVIGLGVTSGASLGSIQVDASPFSAAKWWFLAFVLLAVVPVVAVVFCVIALVKKTRRVVAGISLGLAVLGPIVSVSVGIAAGGEALGRTVARRTLELSGGVEAGRDKLADLIESGELEVPDWLAPILEREVGS
jgi:hypothetical protein